MPSITYRVEVVVDGAFILHPTLPEYKTRKAAEIEAAWVCGRTRVVGDDELAKSCSQDKPGAEVSNRAAGGVGGMDILLDAAMPPDEVEFRDAKSGKLLGKITHLGRKGA
jgi:hypothetical protein